MQDSKRLGGACGKDEGVKKRKPLTRNQRAELFLEHGGKCHICGTLIKPQRGETWEVEHVEALEISGRDAWENLRPAHVGCHKTKTAQDKKTIAKCNRRRAKHLGIARPKSALSKRDGYSYNWQLGRYEKDVRE